MSSGKPTAREKVYRHFALSFIILVILFTGIIYGLRILYTGELLNQTEIFAYTQLNRQKDRMLMYLGTVRFDLMVPARQNILNDLFDSSLREKVIERLEADYLNMCREKKIYDQIRFLDYRGMEMVRVNYNGGEPYVVASEMLQNKYHRYYFAQAFQLNERDIYISRFDLNVEKREIELPLKPMIRFAAPVLHIEDGYKLGIVILNYMGETVLKDFQQIADSYNGNVMLLDHEGYYLSHREKEKLWAFMFPKRVERNFESDFPQLWKLIGKDEIKVIKTKAGVFGFNEIRSSDIIPGTDFDRPLWYVVTFTPMEKIEEQAWKHIRSQASELGLFFILILGGIWFLIYHRNRSLTHHHELSALNRSIRFERDLFVKGPTFVFRWKNDFSWSVEYVSGNISNALGYQVEDFLDKRISMTSIIYPKDLKHISRDIDRMAEENRDSIDHEPFRLVDRDGNFLWVRMYTTAVKTQEGQIDGFYGYLVDITQLKNTEISLENARDYARKLLESAPDPTIVIDVKTYEVRLMNQEARKTYLGLMNNISGITCHKLSHKLDVPCEGKNDPCPIQEILVKKEPVRVLHKHFDYQGDEIYVELIASPILDENGNVSEIIESHRDITERIKLENRLKNLNETLVEQVELEVRQRMLAQQEKKAQEEILIQQSKMAAMGEMIGVIAHQWKQPLNAISIISQGVQDLYEFDELNQKMMEREIGKINKQVSFMAQTIDDFRNFFKPSKEKKPFCVYAAIDEVYRLLKPQFQKCRCAFNLSGDQTLMTLGYANEFKQVVLNIMNNSRDEFMKWSRDDGVIDITVLQSGTKIVVELQDDAGGIPKELLPEKIFEAYVSTKGDGGTGIGLSMSKTIIENNMDGRLSAENKGSGALFRIEIPLHTVEEKV